MREPFGIFVFMQISLHHAPTGVTATHSLVLINWRTAAEIPGELMRGNGYRAFLEISQNMNETPGIVSQSAQSSLNRSYNTWQDWAMHRETGAAGPGAALLYC